MFRTHTYTHTDNMYTKYAICIYFSKRNMYSYIERWCLNMSSALFTFACRYGASLVIWVSLSDICQARTPCLRPYENHFSYFTSFMVHFLVLNI